MKSKPIYVVTLAIALATASFANAQDWRPLFPTDDLSGWEQKSGEWTLSEGILTGKPSTEMDAILLGTEEFGDFDLQFQYRLTAWVFGGALFRLNVQDKNMHGYQ